jgi:general secretion pathway protein A
VLGIAAGAGLLAAATRHAQPELPRVSLTVTPRLAQPVMVASTQPVPAPAPAAPAPPTLLRNEADAWRELAQAWKLAVPEGDPCTALAREQVQCFSRQLSVPVIRQLARPGIVALDAGTGRPSYAILSGLTENTATLRAAGTEQTVTLAALAQRWQGDFSTLYRAPEGFRDGAPPLEWMAAQLAAARGGPAPAGKVRLDASLRSELRAFQLARGLPVDGKPGPLTTMQLNRAGGLDEPRLRTEP